MRAYALICPHKKPIPHKGTPIVPAHAGYGFLLFLTQRRQAFGFGSKNGAHTTLRGGITNMSCRVHQTFVCMVFSQKSTFCPTTLRLSMGDLPASNLAVSWSIDRGTLKDASAPARVAKLQATRAPPKKADTILSSATFFPQISMVKGENKMFLSDRKNSTFFFEVPNR